MRHAAADADSDATWLSTRTDWQDWYSVMEHALAKRVNADYVRESSPLASFELDNLAVRDSRGTSVLLRLGLRCTTLPPHHWQLHRLYTRHTITIAIQKFGLACNGSRHESHTGGKHPPTGGQRLIRAIRQILPLPTQQVVYAPVACK